MKTQENKQRKHVHKFTKWTYFDGGKGRGCKKCGLVEHTGLGKWDLISVKLELV